MLNRDFKKGRSQVRWRTAKLSALKLRCNESHIHSVQELASNPKFLIKAGYSTVLALHPKRECSAARTAPLRLNYECACLRSTNAGICAARWGYCHPPTLSMKRQCLQMPPQRTKPPRLLDGSVEEWSSIGLSPYLRDEPAWSPVAERMSSASDHHRQMVAREASALGRHHSQ
jgi:hypothetical protein